MFDHDEALNVSMTSIPNIERNTSGKYPCNTCGYEATKQGHIKRHIMAKHLNVKFPCDKCEYKATQAEHLIRHKRNTHF